MVRQTLSWTITTALTFFFISCNSPATAPAVPVKETPSRESTNREHGKKNRISDPPDNEQGVVPTVIRSAVPAGYYGYDADTLQVSQYIRRIFQDQKGNLWFGTVGDGVCCYDGNTLTYYTTREGFAGNSVQDIAEDTDGNIWFGTSGGVVYYNGKKFIDFPEQDKISHSHIQSLYIDKLHNVWIGTPDGLCRYNPKFPEPNIEGKLFASFPTLASSPRNVRNITADKSGRVWFATDGNGVYRYSGGPLTHFTEKDGLGGNTVRSILEDNSGIMWFATRGGVTQLNPWDEITGQIKFTNLKDEKGSNEFETLYKDRYGDVWVAVRGGVRRYQGKTFFLYTLRHGLTNCCVQSIFEDRSGNLWLGSGAGLFLFDRRHTLHPCVKGTCEHDFRNKADSQAHESELSKTIINVKKKGPWPRNFR